MICNPGIFIRIRRLAVLILVILASVATGSALAQTQAHSDKLTLVVPGSEGGSWDLTARAMKDALEAEGIVDRVTIVRYPGAGGLIGLSQFVARHRGEEDVLLVGGLVMLSSALREETAVNIADVKPIARLTNEWGVLFSNRRAGLRSLDELVVALRDTPEAVRWGGGTLGGPDHGLLWSIARKTGASLDDVTFFGRTGGTSVVDLLEQGRVDVGVSGYAEFKRSIGQARFRVLGVAAPHRLPGIDAPTLREAGVDATMMNWRGVFGAPGIDAAAQARLTALVAAMERTPSWRNALRAGDWTNAYMDGEAFKGFIGSEQARWHEMLTPPVREPGAVVPDLWERVSRLPPAFVLGLLAMVAAMAALFVWRLHQRKQLAADLERQRNELIERLAQAKTNVGKLVKDGIDIDFDEWKLSGAEADIAWFMLRGLPLREIATLRGTSERTVRQQAQAIYRKAGLEGRSDLAGRVLERFI